MGECLAGCLWLRELGSLVPLVVNVGEEVLLPLRCSAFDWHLLDRDQIKLVVPLCAWLLLEFAQSSYFDLICSQADTNFRIVSVEYIAVSGRDGNVGGSLLVWVRQVDFLVVVTGLDEDVALLVSAGR